MITIAQGQDSFAIDMFATELLDTPVGDLSALKRCRRDTGGMWTPTRETLGRPLAFALKSVAWDVARGQTAELGYGITAVAR